jgi:hypothetical protein
MAIINDNPFIPPPAAPTSVLRAPEPAPIPVPGVPGGLPFCCFKNAAHKSCPTKSPTSAPTISPTKSPTSIPTVQPTISLGYDDDKWYLKNTSPEGFWTSIATNSQGNFVVATQAGSSIHDGSIYISTNYGKLFSQTSAPLNLWSRVSVSETGQYIVASGSKLEDLVFFGQNLNTKSKVYISSNYGSSWSSILPLNYYGDVKIKNNGMLGVIAYNGHNSTSSKILI